MATFSSSLIPIDSFGIPPVAHAVDTTLKSCASIISVHVEASFLRPAQKAIPIVLKFIFLANSTILSLCTTLIASQFLSVIFKKECSFY